MTIPGWAGRRAWPAVLGAAMLLVAGAAAAVPIELLDSRAAGFVGQAEQGPLDQPVLVESDAQFTATFGASTAGLANPYLALPIAAAARLELLDVGGRRVLSREVGALGAGRHTVDLPEGRSVTPELYWVRLTQGTNRRTSRVAVIK